MKDFPRVEVKSRAELRGWLEQNHARSGTVWLVTYKKHVAERYLPYDALVEEALCFGWIDSVPRKLDEDRTMVLLSPRRAGSPWSRANKKRIAKLRRLKLITPAGQARIDLAQQDGSWTVYDDVEDLIVPEDLAAALSKNKRADANFQKFSPSAKKGILWWIKSAKRQTTREKRIRETVSYAAKNLKATDPR